MKRIYLLVLFIFFTGVLDAKIPIVKPGANLLFEKYHAKIKGKKIGLITNHSAVLTDGIHLADKLAQDNEVKLVALFGPEHGIRGDAANGENVQSGTDVKTGVTAYSLYGKVNKPTDDMLKDIDLLVFDIQDVGARFYTFISTMFLTMESAAEHNIPYIVLDRPNPIRGVQVEGPIREDSLKSFVGWGPMPITHGMTVGELAKMANEEGWLKDGKKADLTVIPMEGWLRTMWYDQTGLEWVKPSPNMATVKTAAVFPGTCFLEGTNVSEGRGTEKPFEYIGAPWTDGNKWATELIKYNLPGVTFELQTFKPADIKGVTLNPKFVGQVCNGVFVKVTDRNKFEPVRTGVAVLVTLNRLFPKYFQFNNRWIDRLSGSPRLRLMIKDGKDVDEIIALWASEVKKFEEMRSNYLLYK